MAEPKKIRRVVTGHDAQGRSCVVYDSDVPNKFPRASGTCFNELWTFEQVPVLLSGPDGGAAGRPFLHSPPGAGAHWRITDTPARRVTAMSAEEKTKLDAANSTGGTQRQQGARIEGMHRTPSIDYAVLLAGERHLVLEESDVLLHKGDVVIQLGNWHTWENRSGVPTLMSYVMIGGEFAE